MTVVTDFTALITEDTASWAGNGTVGRPVFVTYSFDLAPPVEPSLSAAFLNSFQPLTGQALEAARNALAQWDANSGIHLIEVPPGQGDIGLGVYNFDIDPEHAPFAGFAYIPSVEVTDSFADELEIGGEIFISGLFASDISLYLHELGHALGLKHPFDGDPTLLARADNTTTTTMSYTGASKAFLGPLDVDAVQYLYGTQDGAHLAHWSWDPAALTLTQIDGDDSDTLIGIAVSDIILGAGGDDRIAGFRGDDTLDGGAGTDLIFGGKGDDELIGGSGADELHGDEGYDIASYATSGAGLEIELFDGGLVTGDAVGDIYWDIEAISGSPFADTLTGDDGVNDLRGAGGDDLLNGLGNDDSLDGGPGTDTASFRGVRDDYQVVKLDGVVEVTDTNPNGDGTDTLSNMEIYAFSDDAFSLSELIAPEETENGVYRFYNAETGTHFYSASLEERNAVIDDLDRYLYEGPAYKSAPEDTDSTGIVWRFFNTETGVHFFTISEDERDAVGGLPQFIFEGGAYSAYTDQVDDATALFRFFNTETGTHFYTASDAEREAVDVNLPEYAYEGIAYYVDII